MPALSNRLSASAGGDGRRFLALIDERLWRTIRLMA
jgi:hypothetical protein